MNAFVGAGEPTPKKPNGIIADLLVDFICVGAIAPGGGGAGDCLFSLVRAMADTKTLACGKNYRFFRTENPCKRKNCPAEQRAALVLKQYMSKARSLDHHLHGTARGTVGLSRPSSWSMAPLTDLTHTPLRVSSTARSASF
jgi:hypothetical protein